MFTHAKGRLIIFISSFFYPVLFLSILFYGDNALHKKAVIMSVLAILSLLWAIILYRRIRLIEDTPTTLLSSAAQGYAALEGKVALYEEEIIRGIHYELPPMVWYQNFFKTSGAGFILEDEKGRCTIDPREAEIITPIYNYNSRYYHSIYPGETIYALGQLETLKKHKTEYERDGLSQSKVNEWKKNQHTFLDYFDADKNGIIDDSEMEAAKNAALREVDDEVEHHYQQPATHVVSTPEDGRPFILSSIHPDKLIRRYNRAIIIHLAAWLYLSILVLV